MLPPARPPLSRQPAAGEFHRVNTLLLGLDAAIGLLRGALLLAAVVVAAGAALSHAVHTRRLSPFGSAGRLVRGTIDPLFAPVERRVLRAGGRPTAAPWWTLAAVVVGGIVLISLLGFLRGQLLGATMALQAGGRGVLFLVLSWAFGLLRLALIVRVASSWFRISPHSPWIRWTFTLTEWLLRPIRQVVPTLGMVDLSPLVAYFALVLLEGVVLSLVR